MKTEKWEVYSAEIVTIIVIVFMFFSIIVDLWEGNVSAALFLLIPLSIVASIALIAIYQINKYR